MDQPCGPFSFDVLATEARHGPEMYDVIYLANGYPVDPARRALHAGRVAEQLVRFPEGQFVATTSIDGQEVVVGTATTLRTSRPPEAPPLSWHQVIGDHGLPHHDPDGAWLYGVEIAVHPAYQRRGIASALYRARLALVPELELEGWYAGGMLMGYHRYADVLAPRAYAERVIAGALHDPTVTMQLRRGLQPLGVIEGYYPEPKAGDCAVLLAWRPPRTGPAKGMGKPVPGRSIPGRTGLAKGPRRVPGLPDGAQVAARHGAPPVPADQLDDARPLAAADLSGAAPTVTDAVPAAAEPSRTAAGPSAAAGPPARVSVRAATPAGSPPTASPPTSLTADAGPARRPGGG